MSDTISLKDALRMIMCRNCIHEEKKKDNVCSEKGFVAVADNEGMAKGCSAGERKPDEIYLDKVEL